MSGFEPGSHGLSVLMGSGSHGARLSRRGLAVRLRGSMQKDVGSIRVGSPFSSNIVVYGHCLVTLPTQLMEH